MKFDEKVKQILENDQIIDDEILLDNEGMFARLGSVFKGGMRRWVFFIYLIAITIGLLTIWSGYQFFTVSTAQQQIFWGFIFMIALNMQGFIKQWLFIESNRNSIMREIKRVEVAIAQLAVNQSKD